LGLWRGGVGIFEVTCRCLQDKNIDELRTLYER
jgi:hypothetical protein